MSTIRGYSQAGRADFETHVAEAQRAQSAGDVHGAISAYQDALKIQPRASELWSNLGLMQHQAGKAAEALVSFTNAHRLQPRLFVPALFMGLENLELGKPNKAVSYLEQARQLNPKDPNVPMYLGRAYFGSKDFRSAAAAYLQATTLKPTSGDAWYRLGLSHLEVAELDSGELATLNKQSPFFRALEADTLSSQDHLDPAAIGYGEVLTSRQHLPCVRSSLGFVEIRQNKSADAETQFQHDAHNGSCLFAQLGLLRIEFEQKGVKADLTPLGALWKTDPGFIVTYLQQLAIGLGPERFAVLDRALSQTSFADLTPDEISQMKTSLHGPTVDPAADKPTTQRANAGTLAPAAVDYSRGRYRQCTNRLMPAIAALSHDRLSLLAACSLFTGDFNSTLAAATKLRHLHGAEEEGLYWSIKARQGLGVRCLLHAGEVEPNSIYLHELLAESYRDMGKYGAAEAEYETVLGMAPNDFPALIGAAANFLQEFRLEPASEMIHRALDRNPSDPEANYIAGEIMIDQHQFGEAAPHLKIALGAKAELIPRVHALLGRVYASQGRDQQAIEELKLGLPSDDDGSIHFQLGRLYQKAGEQKLAESAFEETRRLQTKHQ